MIPNPIHKVLSTLCTHRVQYLLMGGQACVFYGAAEFSRDCDIAILCDARNLDRLRLALSDLEADVIAVPPFDPQYLERGHAVHFRCQAEGVAGIRIDVMAKMRGVAPFEELWSRRTTLTDEQEQCLEILSLPDLVAAKKTQRDKDWPMLRRLVEAHYAQYAATATDEQVAFWLRESRTPAMLIELAANHRDLTSELRAERPLLQAAIDGDQASLDRQLADEERRERDADRAYWAPLRRELEQMRQRRPPE